MATPSVHTALQQVRSRQTPGLASECAIHALAPTCSHCGCRIIGHGMEAQGEFFCCAYCAKHAGAPQMKDRAESATPT